MRDLSGMVQLCDQLGKGRDVVVPLDHGRDGAEARNRVTIKVPNLVAYGMIMGVDDMAFFVAVAGDVELHHGIGRYAMQELVGGEAMIEGADIDVVHVEEEPATGAFGRPR